LKGFNEKKRVRMAVKRSSGNSSRKKAGIGEDITERKQAEETLKESESRWRSLVTSLPEFISLIDKKRRITFLNRYAKGFDEKKVIGTSVYQYISKESLRKFRQSISQCFNTRRVQKGEHLAMGDFGRMRFYKDYFVPIIKDSNIKSVMVISDDVTERRKAEEAILKANAFNSAIVENSPFGIMTIHRDGSVDYVNPTMLTISGDSKANFKEMNVFKLPSYAKIGLSKKIRDCFVGKPFFIGPLEYISHFSKKKTVRNFTGMPMRNEAGKVDEVMLFVEDLTEQKKAEEVLKESEEKYRALFESSADAIMILKPPSWKFTAGNPATVNMFRAKDEKEFSSFGPWDVAPERQPDGCASAEKAKAMIGKAMREGSNFFEWTHKRLNGEEFPTTVLLTRIELSGEKMLQATVRDITKEKKAEEALQRSERQYKALIETTDTGYVILDFQGKVIDANPEYVRLTGHHGLKEIRGRKVIEWTADYEKEKNVKAVTECVKKGYIRNLEIDYIDGHGKITPVEINATIVKMGEEPQILTMCRDITERKKAEAEFKKRTGELEKFNMMAVGRELRMVELKKRIKELEGKLRSK
jgi:PAS domain S-box-containing protein